MFTYLVRRLLWLLPVLFTVALITFTLMHTAPGGPWDRDPNMRQVDAATQRVLNAHYGLDKPLWQQFIAYTIGDVKEGKFVCGALCGNLGPSYRVRGRTVQDVMFEPPKDKGFWYSRFGYSVRLAGLALSFAVVIGISTGIAAALNQNTWVDYVSLFLSSVGTSIPSFVMGIFLIIIFASMLHLIDVIPKSWDDIRSWILPAVVLGFGTLAFTARMTRATMLEVMRQDYVRTARAKGLHERVVVLRHMLRNSLIPVVTLLGPALVNMITAAFIIETMFGFPGMGRYLVLSIQQRDYSMIMGSTLVYVFMISIANLSVDFLYVVLDPRIRLGE
ncbi:MAG: ABC transporter permease [Anaerolineales bacterium]